MMRALRAVREVVTCALRDDITGEATRAAFNLFFAIFPLIITGFAVTGLLGGEPAFVWIVARLQTFVPPEGMAILEVFIEEITTERRPEALWIGMLLTVWAASNFFAALGEGLDRMFGVARGTTSFFRRRAKALVMLVTGGSLLAAGIAVIVLGPWLVSLLGLGIGVSVLRWPLGFLLIAAMFWLTYYVLPNRDQRRIRRELAVGAVAGTTVWLLATAGFNFYAGNIGNYSATYGAVGAVIVLMMWLFLTALAVLFGGEVAHLMEQRGTLRGDRGASTGASGEVDDSAGRASRDADGDAGAGTRATARADRAAARRAGSAPQRGAPP